VKAKSPLGGQTTLLGTVISTWTGLPVVNVPCEGEKVTPAILLLEADQFMLPSDPLAALNVTVQERQPLLNVAGLAMSWEAVQVQSTCPTLAGPLKAKSALTGQTALGTRIVTCTVCPGDNMPVAGWKVTLLRPLAVTDQFKEVFALCRLLIVASQLQP
jgi:hypothetical protein